MKFRMAELFLSFSIMNPLGKYQQDPHYKESSSSLYQAYRNYCIDTNEYVRSTADFYYALEGAGFERVVLNRKRYFKGLRIRNDDDPGEDFLT